eukprot:m.179222 g.179222  ORF g.179222 m.179222 type:complete len:92 (-) comp15474_c0_seq4:1142-1417(-)
MSRNVVQGLAGAVAASASLAATFPLYTLTLRMQAGRVVTITALIDEIMNHWNSLYRGLNSAMWAAAAQSAVYYYFFAVFKSWHDVSGKHSP